MKQLLKKDLRLAMHPMAVVMLLLCTMTLIPNYPYGVLFFYETLGIFFLFLTGRENHDVLYSLTLPVSKREIVQARLLLVNLLELLQMVLSIPFTVLRNRLIAAPNAAGMEAGLVLYAQGFLLFGLFNWVFFRSFYKDCSKVGTSFLKASLVFFAVILLDTVATYAVSFVRDVLDTKDPRYLGTKTIVFAVSVVFFVLINLLTAKTATKRFEKQDISL